MKQANTRIPAIPLLTALLVGLCQSGAATAASPTSFFQDDWLKAVVSLEVIGSTNQAQPVGTGFLLVTPHQHILLCTAKHVILDSAGQPREALGFRLNDQRGDSILLLDSKLRQLGLGNWFTDDQQDLACRFTIRKSSSDLKAIPVERFLPRNLASVGTPLMMLGFPLGLRSQGYATPIARRAMVALNGAHDFIIDAFAFPGNSGGPVVYAPVQQYDEQAPNRALRDQYLVGMVISAITYVEKAVSEKTQRPRVTFEENAGLTNIIPSDVILRLLKREDVQELDRQLR